MTTTQLTVYNIALRAVGERPLSSLSEDRDPRRSLDEVWNAGVGVVTTCLEQGLWNFAMRAVRIDYDSASTPSFGFTYAFTMPTDFVRLDSLSADENFNTPLEGYEVEAAKFYAETTPIYMRYVSNGNTYGSDLSLWPGSFTLWVGHWMATQIAPRLKNDLDMDRLEKRTLTLLRDARSKDAQMERTRYKPLGAWSRSRYGGGRRGDRGPRGSLLS